MKITVDKIVKIGILTAAAYILQLLEFPIFVFPSFLSFDFSEVPVLLGAFAMGPLAGVLIEFLKNALHLFNTHTFGVGELANFIVGCALVVPAALIYKMNKKRFFAILGLTVGIVSMAVIAAIMNYFVMIPFYATVLHFPMSEIIKLGTLANSSIKDLASLIVIGIIPFNLLKGFVSSAIILLIYKKMSPLLHRDSYTRKKETA